MKQIIFYQAHTEPVTLPPVVDPSVNASPWYQPWALPIRQRILPALAVALIASGPIFPVQTVTETISPDKWFNWLSQPVRAKPGLATHLQQAFTISPAALTVPETVTESRWHQPWSEPVRQPRRLHAALNPYQFTVEASIFTPAPTEAGWHQPWSERLRVDLRRGLAAHLQQTATISPTALIAKETVTEDRWHQAWSEPIIKQRVSLRVAAMPAAFLTEALFDERIFYDKWGFAWSEPIRLNLHYGRLLAGQQQALVPNPFPLPNKPMFWGTIIT